MVLGGPFREKKWEFLILLEILRINQDSAKFQKSCGILAFLWEKLNLREMAPPKTIGNAKDSLVFSRRGRKRALFPAKIVK